MKLLLISPYSKEKVGGIGTWSITIIDYIRRNYSDKIDLNYQNTAFEKKGNINKKIISRVFFGIYDSISIIIKTFINLLFNRPDVVHYTSSASLALYKDYLIAFLCKVFKVRFVIHFHFGRLPQIIKEKGWEYKWILRVCKLSSVVIVIDKQSYIDLAKELDSYKIFYIPNPVIEKVFELAQNEHIKTETNTVIYAGHVVPTKGLTELVMACSQTKTNLDLIIFGPGNNDYINSLRQIADQKNNGNWIHFKGEVKREFVIEELDKASVFCLPSYSEGFPYSILEAMAMGTAIIATPVGAISEMINSNPASSSGILVPIKNVNQLQFAIEELINNPSKTIKLGNNGRNKILREYNLNVIFPQYLKVWKNECV